MHIRERNRRTRSGRSRPAADRPARRPAATAVFVALVLMATTLGAESLLLRGGTLHTLAGESPFEGDLLVEGGTIAAVGQGLEAEAGAAELDVSGLHLYPGLFDASSQLGLVEINSVAATVDATELGGYNPHLVAASAIHPASEVIRVTRANGITHVIVAPRGGGGASRDGSIREASVLPGQASLIHLAGWTAEEMGIEPAVAMVLAWPAIQTRTFDLTTFSMRSANYNEAKKKAEAAQQELENWFDAARHYAQAIDAASARTRRDLRLEALAKVLDGGQLVIVQADAERDIVAAIDFAAQEGLRIAIAGGREAWKVKERLAEEGIPVILGLTQSLPEEEDDPYDRPFRNAAELHRAGVLFAFGSAAAGGMEGPGGPHGARSLPYEAATAVAFGLPPDEALLAITLYPAQIFGVEDRLGTLEPGKMANLIVTDGDPLEITTRIRYLIIDGKRVPTDNKHRELYERYRARPLPGE